MKQKKLENLKVVYLLIIILGALVIGPTHIFPIPTFMYARFPHYLEMMGSFLGVSWPATFEIYHYVLYALAIIVSTNLIGIMFYPKFRKITIASSLTGITLTAVMSLFLFFPFMKVNISTSITYGSYSTILLITNILTLRAISTRQKEA